MAELAAIGAAFEAELRRAGIPVTANRTSNFLAATALIEPRDLAQLYWIGRTTLLTDQSQFEAFDAVFNAVFRGTFELADSSAVTQRGDATTRDPHGERSPGEPRSAGESGSAPSVTSATPGAVRDGDDADAPSVLAAMSSDERLRDTHFSALTAQELELVARLAEQLPLVPPLRNGRRHARHRRGARIDVRATLRRARRTGGDPAHLVRRKRVSKPRRVVLLADVSGSMEPYARVYLHLMRSAVTSINAESFMFATRMTRVTRALSGTRPDAAYQAAVDSANDMYGGTRIGASLHGFIERHGRRGMARGAVVVIVSDGWERDDPALLAENMSRLSRLAHRIIWVNPRKAGAEYQPLVGGMAAALPFVDTFVSGHSLSALEEVMSAIAASQDR